jgi:hypothetical protein
MGLVLIMEINKHEEKVLDKKEKEVRIRTSY